MSSKTNISDVQKIKKNLKDINVDVLKRQYSELSRELSNLNIHNNLIESVNDMDNKQDNINQNLINSLDADLMTTRRQVEIINNRNLIKEDLISLLKVLFTLLSLAFINLTFNDTIYKKHVFIGLIIVGLLYLASKVSDWTSRNVNRWTVKNYPNDTKALDANTNPTEQEELDECALEEKELANKIVKAKSNILNKLIALKDKQQKIQTSRDSLIRTKTLMEAKYDENLKKANELYNDSNMTKAEREAINNEIIRRNEDKFGTANVKGQGSPLMKSPIMMRKSN